MKILVTGGAGFIGRWVVDQLLKDNHQVWVLDDLSNGRRENLETFYQDKNFMDLVVGDIKDQHILNLLFNQKFDICFHLAASINVQDSIDDPKTTFENDVIGTFNVLEQCRIHSVKMVFMSTCMVYQQADGSEGISEKNPAKPASPYAGSKLAAENMCLSYYHSYGLPITVIRPFNTYGPYQKTGGEGGVVAIFLKNKLAGQPVNIYGSGNQTRDLLFVEDCARFIVKAGYTDQVNGEIVNAGLGEDISINKLAELIVDDQSRIKHIQHIHPQSEIPRLVCDYQKAKRLLDWNPSYSLKEGIKKTESWIQSTNLI
ncbi:dTDP-glucose 4,6-dehydratase [Alkalibacillus salilacus]|uniref:Nucleoside-diphosphate-sugar epimerase n=1 Tax=Alkalibacillus salilacus TaxID=284582 RepID=A0ABT9VFK2_9BACI|nr:GDP-mannose 4,6-dehydratase [Alkalibacillus salilacus]MDQ0159585.1 nucleoside-diphosphate-sugar epimerase [Alkalibacillus salilacus]